MPNNPHGRTAASPLPPPVSGNKSVRGNPLQTVLEKKTEGAPSAAPPPGFTQGLSVTGDVLATGSLGSNSGTVSVSTSSVVIRAGLSVKLNLIIVGGSSGGNQFADLILVGFGATPPKIISSNTINGSPAARTYAVVATTNLFLQMASGTYTVETGNLGVF